MKKTLLSVFSVIICYTLLITGCGKILPVSTEPGTTKAAAPTTEPGTSDVTYLDVPTGTINPDETGAEPETSEASPDATTEAEPATEPNTDDSTYLDVPTGTFPADETSSTEPEPQTLTVTVTNTGGRPESECWSCDDSLGRYSFYHACTVTVSGSGKNILFYVNAYNEEITFVLEDATVENTGMSVFSFDNATLVTVRLGGASGSSLKSDYPIVSSGVDVKFSSEETGKALKLSSGDSCVFAENIEFNGISCEIESPGRGVYARGNLKIIDSRVTVKSNVTAVECNELKSSGSSAIDLTGSDGIRAHENVSINSTDLKIVADSQCVDGDKGIIISGNTLDLLSKNGNCLTARTTDGVPGQMTISSKDARFSAPEGIVFSAEGVVSVNSGKITVRDTATLVRCSIFNVPSTLLDVEARLAFGCENAVIGGVSGTPNRFKVDRIVENESNHLSLTKEYSVFTVKDDTVSLKPDSTRGNVIIIGRANVSIYGSNAVVFGSFEGEEKTNRTSTFTVKPGEYKLYNVSDMNTPLASFTVDGEYAGLTIAGVRLYYGDSYILDGPSKVEWTQSDNRLFIP
ncbi:MAG: carbohydrate-binding domain-containing protein [Clostridia bacterium]|nr:carbohydrate-binding domain-containing protein [Clostridia bacterium]